MYVSNGGKAVITYFSTRETGPVSKQTAKTYLVHGHYQVTHPLFETQRCSGGRLIFNYHGEDLGMDVIHKPSQ